MINLGIYKSATVKGRSSKWGEHLGRGNPHNIYAGCVVWVARRKHNLQPSLEQLASCFVVSGWVINCIYSYEAYIILCVIGF